MSKTEYILRVNGKSKNIFSSEDKPLLYILRDEFNLIGTKLGCGLEQCGSCAVLVDGNKVLSCNRPAIEFVDKEITTIEAWREVLLETLRYPINSRIPTMIALATSDYLERKHGS